MRILKNIFIIFSSLGLSIMLVLMTMSFSQNPKAVANSDSFGQIDFFIPNFVDGNFEKEKITNGKAGDVVYTDLGRLTSIFFLSGENPINEAISRSGNVVTFDGIKGIFSGYDPFATYELEDKEKNFNLSQITNGSFYFGENNDGTISLYSIDSVSKLTFYFDKEGEKKEATNMILFPGMMIRFDPQKNHILENKDLLGIKIILTSNPDNSKNQNDTVKNTGFNFSVARTKDESSGSEIFFVSGLPIETRVLFSRLHDLLYFRTKNVENLKSYSKNDSLGISSKKHTEVANPSKNAFRLLGNLQIIFSKGVNGEISPSEFRDSVNAIITETEKFESNNSAKKLLEQFLIDGRFALFTNEGTNLAQYQALYNEAANILGIVPTTGKGKLFQSLSNIFSRNLISENIKTFSESYGSIAASLKDTLAQSGIDEKDYFDISLYAYYILDKVRNAKDGVGFDRLTIESSALYQLYSTIIDASQRYVASRPASIQLNTQLSLIVEFYNDMLLKLNSTLYSEYIDVDEGYLFVKKGFLNRGLPDFTAIKSMILDVENFYKKISGVYNDKVKSSKTNDIFEERIAQLEGFLNIINRDNYYIYRENPYKSNDNNDKYPPVYNKKTKKLVNKNSNQKIETSKTQTIEEDSNNDNNKSKTENTQQIKDIISSINSTFNINIDEKNVIFFNENQKNFYKVNIKYQNKNISFNIENNLADNVIVSNNGTSIKIEDKLSLISLKLIINSFSNYEKKIQSIVNENKITDLKNISISISSKSIFINNKKFPL